MWEWETAVMIIQDPEGRVLLVQQNYGHRFFGLPGGKIEEGETPAQAAIRETREETGLVATTGERLFLEDLVYPGGLRFGAHGFAATSVDGTAGTPDGDEIASVAWYRLDDLPYPLTPSATAILPKLRD